ncbi:acyl transferase/acyl hydrolase/lysophospholipase [Flagelloscypha sp. PMI_526]|nr:acyl transferase/acyl hydrolase/lysophospholipase [Flagelloscypha sp. PMI_526]
MPVSIPSSPSDGVRLLSFDGGGIHSVTQALMVREMMHRVEEEHQLPRPPKVSDFFDMICGSGLGGLLAVMCGVFHMTGDQLVEEYVNMCKVLFSKDLGTAQRTIKLDQEIKRLTATYSSGGEERRMISLGHSCKTFVGAASSQNPSHPRLLRNYRSLTNPSPDCTIREAVRATAALSRLFDPIVIRDKHLSERFDGGELKWNNPTDKLTKEAAREFQSRHVATIVSIGSGHPSHLSLAEGLADLFPIIALDCERLSEDIERRFGNTPELYWRLSGQHVLQNLATDLSDVDALVPHTPSCLQDACTQREISSLTLDLVLQPRRILAKMISRRGSSTAKVVSPRVCPLPSEYFTGRRRPLKGLEDYFNSRSDKCHVAVLYGMGGTGKTEMGLQFVHQNQSRFSSIYFIDTSSQLSLETDLIAIASETSGQPSVDDALRTIRNRQDEWLLFFDNADDLSLNLQPYLSWSHGNIIITTRHWELCVHAPKCSISVEHLEMEDAKELLLRGLPGTDDPNEQETAAHIVQELGCSALAVSQARMFRAKSLCSLSGYLPIYVQNRKKLIECEFIQRSGDSLSSEHAAWEISFKKLSSNAALLLKFLSFMHHDNIPSRLFQDAWEVYADQDEDTVPPILFEFCQASQQLI